MVNKTEDWQKVGYLKTGEAVYCNSEGEHAKEVDHTYLIELAPGKEKLIVPERG